MELQLLINLLKLDYSQPNEWAELTHVTDEPVEIEKLPVEVQENYQSF